jgi:hypothetical protein
MSDKRKHIAINLTPTPAERWAKEQRAQSLRQSHLDRMMTEARDG